MKLVAPDFPAMTATVMDHPHAGRRVLSAPTLVVWIGMALTAIYFVSYFGNPAVPGNHGHDPQGWWRWWDQSRYLLSAQSFSHREFEASHHWYPPAYALLGAPFALLSAAHLYLLPDLGCLLLTYAAFLAFAGTVGVGRRWAAGLFLLATSADEISRTIWAEPWSTSLSCALIWWLLALTGKHLVLPGNGHGRLTRLFCIGCIIAVVPFTRPADSVVVAIWVIWAGTAAIRLRAIQWTDMFALCAGAAAIAAPEALVWVSIYGPHESQYIISSGLLGLEFGNLGWKTYLLLVTPRPWYPAGAGLVQRLPWVMPGLAGVLALPSIMRDRPRMLLMLLAAVISGYCLLFFAYVDLIPSGLWRYHNVHYFKWTLPGLALFGFIMLRALALGPRIPVLMACMILMLPFLLRLSPKLVGDAEPAWLIQQPGPIPGWDEAYFTTLIPNLCSRDSNRDSQMDMAMIQCGDQ